MADKKDGDVINLFQRQTEDLLSGLLGEKITAENFPIPNIKERKFIQERKAEVDKCEKLLKEYFAENQEVKLEQYNDISGYGCYIRVYGKGFCIKSELLADIIKNCEHFQVSLTYEGSEIVLMLYFNNVSTPIYEGE